jgi:hypothetical protein
MTHFGLQLPDGRIAHFAPGRGEHISSIEEFRDGPGCHHAIGSRRARAQSTFAIHELADNCAVLRLSSDGYLCVGIDFKKRVALGMFRFLDPK